MGRTRGSSWLGEIDESYWDILGIGNGLTVVPLETLGNGDA